MQTHVFYSPDRGGFCYWRIKPTGRKVDGHPTQTGPHGKVRGPFKTRAEAQASAREEN